MEIKKPYAVGQYNKFMKCIYRADRYHSYNSVLNENIMVEIGGTVSAELCALQTFLCTEH